MRIQLTPQQIKEMIEHWLNTPANSYYGQSYGESNKSILLKPLTVRSADAILSKLKRDIPLLAKLNSDELSIREQLIGHDTKSLYIAIGSIFIPLNIIDKNPKGDTFNANAQ